MDPLNLDQDPFAQRSADLANQIQRNRQLRKQMSDLLAEEDNAWDPQQMEAYAALADRRNKPPPADKPKLDLIGTIAKMRHLAGAIRGFGAYKIGSNTLMCGGMTPPMVVNSMKQGGVIVRHREYLRDVNPSNVFNPIQFSINPGLPGTFPWLSQIAASFEQYRFRGLLFEYKTTSSDNILSGAASTALGTVVMGTQYNVLDDGFDTKFEMENYEFSNSSKPSLSMIHPIETKKSESATNLFFVRTPTTDTSKGDLRFYDLANFTIATVGMQGQFDPTQPNFAGNASIGELWCTYEVEFFKPVLKEDDLTQSVHFDFNNHGNQVQYPVPRFPTSGNPLGGTQTNPPQTIFNPTSTTNPTLPAQIDTTHQVLIFNDSIGKKLLVNMAWTFPTNTVAYQSFVLPTPAQPSQTNDYSASYGISTLPLEWINDTQPQFSTVQPFQATQSGITQVSLMFIVRVISDFAYVKINGFTLAGLPQCIGTDIWVTELGRTVD